MIRNKLYDEFEKEGYSYIQYLVGGQVMPHVYNLTEEEDWVEANPTAIINGQIAVNKGSKATDKTLSLLKRLMQELSKPGYSDYYSKALFEKEEKTL